MGYLSLSGSVPVMASLRPGPRTLTPHRCSVAYRTATSWPGKEGRVIPSISSQNGGPYSSKFLSARRDVTIMEAASSVAKLDYKGRWTPLNEQQQQQQQQQ